MSLFTPEEFNIMVDEIIFAQPASYRMLAEIMRKTLPRFVTYLCSKRGKLLRGYEEDILQEVYSRIIVTCDTHFLQRNGVGGPINRDPDGFASWMRAVASNVVSDNARYIARLSEKTQALDEVSEPSADDEAELERVEAAERARRLLNIAFSIVLDAEQGVHKVLTWTAQAVYYIEYDYDRRSESTKKIIDRFAQKTLFEMRDTVFAAANKIEWLRIGERQTENINNALGMSVHSLEGRRRADGTGEARFAPDDKRRVGDLLYREVFMAKGGNSSVSDWVNRMDKLVRKLTSIRIDEDGTLKY